MHVVNFTLARDVPRMLPQELCAELIAHMDPEAVVWGDLAAESVASIEAKSHHALRLLDLLNLIRMRAEAAE